MNQTAGREWDACVARDVFLWQDATPPIRLGQDLLPLMRAPGDPPDQARELPAFSTELDAVAALRQREAAREKAVLSSACVNTTGDDAGSG